MVSAALARHRGRMLRRLRKAWPRLLPLLLISFLIFAVLLAAAIFFPWILRGVIISGYPLFPSSALGAPVAWKIPKAAVSHFHDVTL